MELILDDYEVDVALTWEPEDVPNNAAAKRKVTKACSLISRGLGDVPMASVLKFSECAKHMWEGLVRRYGSSIVFNKARVLSDIMRKRYRNQKMDIYIAEWEMLATKLKSIDEALEDTTLVTMFFESFGAGKHKEYGSTITALQTIEEVNWEVVTTRMLQEYTCRTKKEEVSETALTTNSQSDLSSQGGGKGRNRND